MKALRRTAGFFAGIALLVFPLLLTAATVMEEKLNLEKSIQERAERLVEKITGTKEMVVLVNVDLDSGKPEETEKKDGAYPGLSVNEEEYLPGITYSQLPVKTKTSSVAQRSVVISKITVTIIVDKNVRDDLIESVRKEVFEILGLSPIRGDVVEVRKISFAIPQVSWKNYFSFISTNVYWIFTLLLIATFLFGPMNSFFKSVVRSIELKLRSEAEEKSAGYFGMQPGGKMDNDIAVNKLSRGGNTGSSPATVSEERKRFSFINENNMKKLAFILRDEKAEKIGLVLNYLPAGIASQILPLFMPDMQYQIAMELSQTKIYEMKEVDLIESEIRSKIDHFIGGEDFLASIIEKVDRKTMLNIISAIKRDRPALAEKLRSSIFYFEDLMLTPASSQ
jgi:hypothetical protein